MPEPTVRQRLCVATLAIHKAAACSVIRKLDPQAVFDPEGNPTLFWVITRLTWQEVEALPEVKIAFPSADQDFPEEVPHA